jgi:hypothetical protein
VASISCTPETEALAGSLFATAALTGSLFAASRTFVAAVAGLLFLHQRFLMLHD